MIAYATGRPPRIGPDHVAEITAQQMGGLRTLSTTMRDGAICLFREAEGVSVLLPVELAEAEGLPVEMPMCQITLQVYSSLAGVG